MVTTRRSTRLIESSMTQEIIYHPARPIKRFKTLATSAEATTDAVVVDDVPARKKKATKEEPRPDEYRRRVASSWKVGAHVSAAGGVENAVQNAAAIGANSFALFLKSQRKWSSPPLQQSSILAFKSRMKAFGYSSSHVLPHGSYLINLGNPDQEKRDKSYECFLDDLKRCEQLGLDLYNFHPGSTVGLTDLHTSITLIAECLNRAHKETHSVVTVIENMAGSGNIIGSSFGDIANIIGQVEDKCRVGVCIDTCHLFAAGYDIRTKDGWESTISDFDTRVGLSYLRGIHLNDSKTPFASKRDRHENIGMGHIGLPAFRHILADPRLQNIPIVLETPSFESTEIWTKEVQILNQLSVMDNKDEDQTAMAAMRTEIENLVRSVVGDANVTSKSRMKKVGSSTSLGKRARDKAGEE